MGTRTGKNTGKMEGGINVNVVLLKVSLNFSSACVLGLLGNHNIITSG